jgi:hypothetical protein
VRASRKADNIIAILEVGFFQDLPKIDVFSIMEGTPPLAGESDEIIL